MQRCSAFVKLNFCHAVVVLQVRTGLQKLSQRIIGSNTLVQGALPAILEKTPTAFYEDTITRLHVSFAQQLRHPVGHLFSADLTPVNLPAQSSYVRFSLLVCIAGPRSHRVRLPAGSPWAEANHAAGCHVHDGTYPSKT